MSSQTPEESPVTWDIEGWVEAALRNWAREDELVQVVGRTNGGLRWIAIHVDGREVATVLVRT